MTEQPIPKRVRLNVGLDEDLHRELRILAAERGEHLTDLVPRLLRQAVRAERDKLAQT